MPFKTEGTGGHSRRCNVYESDLYFYTHLWQKKRNDALFYGTLFHKESNHFISPAKGFWLYDHVQKIGQTVISAHLLNSIASDYEDVNI